MRVLGIAVLSVLLTAACGTTGPSARPTSPTTSAAPPPVVKTSGQASGVECIENVRTVDLAYWEDTLTSSTPVRITSVEVVGHRVRVLGGLLVPVVGGAVRSTGVSDWPPTSDALLRKEVDWRHRTRLIGGRLPVQRAMLPILRIGASGGGRLAAVVFHVRADDGQTATVRLRLGFRFSPTTC
ncbi:MAG: hypothetical protein ACJ72E_00365 [Marmoricola sp.]